MPTIFLNETSIFYETTGQGQPVALLNGIMMSTQSWASQLEVLQTRYRCILHDTRGQLMSGKPEGPYTMAQHVEDFRALLDYLEVHRCHVVGTSYGGEIGMIFACTYPERVRSLSVISSVSQVGPLLRAKVLAWRHAALQGPETLYRVLAADAYSDRFLGRNPGLIDAGADRLSDLSPDFFTAFAHLVDAFLELHITDRLSHIGCPTLVACGELDLLKPVSYSRLIADSIPGAELMVIPNAGHAVVLEQPQAVNTLLLGFIEKHRLPQR